MSSETKPPIIDRVNRVRNGVEESFERMVFAARWALAPFYLGMVLALGVLLMEFIRETANLVGGGFDTNQRDVVLDVLSLIDLSLIANLVLIVIFAGYENFISKIDVAKGHSDRPDWMGRVDYSGLKIKVIGSLVAISSIQLLKDFLLSDDGHAPPNLKWRIYIHLVFLLSGVMFGLMDYIAVRRESFERTLDREIAADHREAAQRRSSGE
ncbi:MAG: TIGR00645 family protein [Actinomycetes bacterium]